MAVGVRKAGQFCWINILTADLPGAKAFFEKVLGWTYFSMGEIGFGIRVDGKDMGGMFDLNSPQTPPGTPPVIGVMVKVENADQTAERVKALGGTVKMVMDVFDAGRMAVCQDPNGANFDVWQPKKEAGTTVDDTLPGAFSWSETITGDVPKAKKFYCDLFGWTAEAMPMPDFEYTVFSLGTERVAGMMPIMPNMGQIPSHWGTYFTVANVDETVRVAKAAGGTIQMEPMDIPNVGRFAMIASPQGVAFYVITYLPMR
jgi:predicted enzyme related to lactoylglutathione lyase